MRWKHFRTKDCYGMGDGFLFLSTTEFQNNTHQDWSLDTGIFVQDG